MNLTKLSLLSIAVVAMTMIGQSEASAQTQGYQFGIGYGYANGLNYGSVINRGNRFGFLNSGGIGRSVRDDIPHFALYPPVYYSEQIVRRPYGVSPFAAPPGITPVEMQFAPEPAVITNPYFRTQEVEETIIQEDQIEVLPKEKKDLKKKEAKNKGVQTSASNDTSTQRNLIIMNPYFVPQSEVGKLARVIE